MKWFSGRFRRNSALTLILLFSAWIQFTVVDRTEVIQPLRADAKAYFSYANNLRHYRVYSGTPTWLDPHRAAAPTPDKLTTPGYPVFLALIGDPQPNLEYLHRVVMIQALLGTLSVWLMYGIAARFLPDDGALVAALLVAISPHLAIISVYLLTESLFVFALFAAIYGTLRAAESSQRWPWLAAGVLWGLASLIRPVVMFVPPLFLLATALPKFRFNLKPAALLFLAFIATQAPWQWRNLTTPVAKGEPSLMVNFLNYGSYPNFMYEDRPESYGIPYRFDPNRTRNERDLPSVLGHIASRFRDQPSTYLRWYLIGKPGFFLSWTNIDGEGDVLIYSVAQTPYFDDVRFHWLRIIALFLHWPLMLLGFAGAMVALLAPDKLGLGAPQRLAAGVVAGIFIYALAFHMIGAPLPRYGIPFRPLLYPFAVLLLCLAGRRALGQSPLDLQPTGTN